MRKTIIGDIVAGLYIFLFVYAAINKLIEYKQFQAQLQQSPLITSFAGVVSWSIPSLEIIIAILLATNRYRRYGLYASFCLMTMFSAYIFAITRFSEFIPCSCGGVLQNMNWNQHLIFNTVFVILSIIALLVYEERRGTLITSRFKQNKALFK